LNGLLQWIVYYYNPIGFYPLWGDNWPEGSRLPNASLIFWSVALKVIFVVIFILWQKKQEAEGKEFSLKAIILLKKLQKKENTMKMCCYFFLSS
jgi:hypothetical protein